MIVYQLLTGHLPYHTDVPPRIRTRKQLRALTYRPARAWREDLPPWLDATLARASHPEPPHRRYPALSELLYELRHPPGQDWRTRHHPPLMERHPVRFWQGVSALLLLALLTSLAGVLDLNSGPFFARPAKPRPPAKQCVARRYSESSRK